MTRTLAVHGFPGSPQSWDFAATEADGVWLIPALVGHAGSSADRTVHSFQEEIDRLLALAEPAGPVQLVGYSLGARLALGMALTRPSLVERLILISGHFGLESPAERQERRASDAAWAELLLTRGLSAFVDAWQAQPLWSTQAHLPSDLRARKRAERSSHEAAGLARSLAVTGLAEMPSYRARLGELPMPTTVVAGMLDRKFADLGRTLASRIPHATLELVPDAGHDLLLERPEFISEVIRRGKPT